MATATMTMDEMIDRSERVGFSNAATLLRFAVKVLHLDIEDGSTWVVLRAIDAAEQELRAAIDQGDDMNVVDARLSALRLRLGISGIRDIFTAGAMADDAVADGYSNAASAKASQMLQHAADVCYRVAFKSGDDE